jgi:hypothetical protein
MVEIELLPSFAFSAGKEIPKRELIFTNGVLTFRGFRKVVVAQGYSFEAKKVWIR